MIKMERLFRKGFLSSVLAASLILGGVPLNGFLTPVFGKTPDKTITGLGTGAIGDPVAPNNLDTPWTGSFVYYGKYDTDNDGTAEPVKYRVLDSAATEFGGNTLFLDCDTVLYEDYFDRDGTPNPGAQKANEWAYSDVKKGLIGENFLEKDGCFTGPEKKAIAESTVGTHTVTVGSYSDIINSYFTDYTELHGDTVFLLDVGDVLNPSYGYSSDSGRRRVSNINVKCRKKSEDNNDVWILRSPINGNDTFFGVINFGYLEGRFDTGYVSPAFNVDLSSIIFTSLISGTAGQPGAEYKLTLKDDNMNIAVTDGKAVTRKDDTVTVPYTITTGTNAGNATQVSVLITDKPYKAGEAVTSGFYYKKLNVGSWNTSGTGTFDIPNTYRDKTWGKDYHVYIFAEDVNGEKETDYASKPEEIHIHTLKHYDRKEPSDTSDGIIEYWECLGCGELFSDEAGTHKISRKDTVIPKLKKISATATGFSGTYDGKAHGITVKVTDPSSGAAVRYGTVEGTCDKTTSPEYTEVGTYTVYYKVTAEGYSALTGQAVIEIKDKKEDRSDLDDPGKKDDPGKDEKPVIPIPADNIVIDIPDDSPVERDSVTGEDFVNDVGGSLAEAAESLGKKEGESSDLYVEFNKELSDEEITNYLNRPEKLTISVNSVSSDSLDSDASKESAAEEAGLKLADPKAMTPSVEIKIDIYSDDGVHVGTVKKLDRGIDLKIDVSGFTEEVISIAKSFLIMSRHTPAEKWFIAGVGILDPETKTVRKTVREFSEFAVAADSREVVGIEAEDGLKADKGALDSEIEKLVKDSVKAYRLLKDGSIEYDVPGEVYSVGAKIEPGRTVSQASVAISLTVNEGYRDAYFEDPESRGYVSVELTSSEPEKPAPESADGDTAAITVTVSDNKPMDIRTETLGDYQVTYAHEIPFFGKSKPTVANFGETFTVSKGTESYKVTKIKVNKKKHLIQITGLEGADKDTVKAVKKATKGSSGLSFKVNPYYVRDTDDVNTKAKKDGSLKSVKVKINGKDYKAKKTEYDYDITSKLITFKGENLAGSCTVK